MPKNDHISAYEIDKVPDPAYSQYQAAAVGGNVKQAIGSAFEHLLRVFSHMPPDSFSAEIVYQFDPKGDGLDRQSRLKMYLWLSASNKVVSRNLDRLIRSGPVSCYYKFLPIEKIPDVKGLKANCEIVRREDFTKPLYSPDYNYKSPAYYYSFTQFVANQENDYLMLDQVLDCIDEKVTIKIRVQPVDISAQVQAHAVHLARLGSVNNRWDGDDEDFGDMGYTDHQYSSLYSQLKPSSKKDPLVNDILQIGRQNHKRLPERHLSFNIAVKTKTQPVAMLVISTLAEGAFKEGSYCIVNEKGNSSVASDETNHQNDTISASSQHIDNNMELKDYEQLRPLSRLATVDELSGVFRLLIGGYFSPCCIRKNTDPPHQSPENMIVLGYDMEVGGGSTINFSQPRGISFSQMNKHLFVTAIPGSGKSTAIMNILLQLHSGGLCYEGKD
jgi:hypothetical protein